MAHYNAVNIPLGLNNHYKYEIFREDVIDRLICIVKLINSNNIPTQIDYNKLLQNLINNFKLKDILVIINLLAHDKFIKENIEIYNIAIKYCNEIIDNEIIVNIMPLDKKNIKEKTD